MSSLFQPTRLGGVRWTWSFGQRRVSYSQPILAECVERHPRKDGDMALVELNEEQSVSAEVKPLTAKGNPAPIQGDVVWNLSDPSVGTLTVDSSDSKKATFTAAAVEGVKPSDITAEFDADLGDGVRTITAIGQIVVKDAEAATAEIAFGTPA